MFTGIVEEIGKVVSADVSRLTIGAGNILEGMQLGGSIAVNGACLTVTGFDKNCFSVDIMAETQNRTNLGLLRPGNTVNLERPMALGGELGGHLMQGHVDDTGRIASIKREGTAILVRVEAPPEVMHYIVAKGFIAVDGASLTIVTRDTTSFRVSLVDYTRQHTTLGSRQVGDPVNLEVDIIAKYVEQFNQARRPGITADLLKEHGFLAS